MARASSRRLTNENNFAPYRGRSSREPLIIQRFFRFSVQKKGTATSRPFLLWWSKSNLNRTIYNSYLAIRALSFFLYNFSNHLFFTILRTLFPMVTAFVIIKKTIIKTFKNPLCIFIKS